MSLLFYLNLDFFFFHFYSLHVQNKVKFGSNKIGSQQMHLVFGFSLNHIIMTAMRCLVGSAGAFEIFDLPQQVELKLQMFEAFFSEHLKWSLLCIKTQFQVFFFFFFLFLDPGCQQECLSIMPLLSMQRPYCPAVQTFFEGEWPVRRNFTECQGGL